MGIGCNALDIVALLGWLPTAVIAAQTLQPRVTCIRNRELVVVESCSIRDLSDAGTCIVQHPDRPMRNALTVSSKTHGTATKEIVSCTPPSAQESGRAGTDEKKLQNPENAAGKRSIADADAIEEPVHDVTADKPTQTVEQHELALGVPDNFKSNASTSPAGRRSYATFMMVAFPNQSGIADSMAGHTFVLLKDTFDKLLLKSGIRPPPGKTILQAWGQACRKGAPERRQVVDVMIPHVVAGVRMDATGKVRFSPAVSVGTYYLFGSSRYSNHAVAWDFPVILKPGTNWITLDQSNGTPFD